MQTSSSTYFLTSLTTTGEIKHAFESVSSSECRAVVLAANGKSFSAGADLNWMKKMVTYTEQQNKEDSYQLFDMFNAIKTCDVPVIARVNGAALGGGSGLVAACDMAFSMSNALFGFTEVKLGLIPAVISRFVMEKISPAHARRFFLTGERFNAETATKVGLIQEYFDSEEALDEQINTIVKELSGTSPAAIQACKELIETVTWTSTADSKEYVAGAIAKARVSEEGQEGLSAFLEKRRPSYVKKW